VDSCSRAVSPRTHVEPLCYAPIEDAVAEKYAIHPEIRDYGIRLISLPGYSYVYVNAGKSQTTS